MNSEPNLLVIAASARALAQSAIRAGYQPWWMDLYGDADTRGLGPGVKLGQGAYPASLKQFLAKAPDVPVVFGGAIENHPGMLRELEAGGKLLGHTSAQCATMRDQQRLRACLEQLGFRTPKICLESRPPDDDAWLLKPMASAGGLGIHRDSGQFRPDAQYWQRFQQGQVCSGNFIATDEDCALLGVCEVLNGEPCFGADDFQYCGSIGPLSLDGPMREQWEQLGSGLTGVFGMRGLFGVDCVVDDGVLWPLEVNPRYTAAIEVLEQAFAATSIDRHVAAWTSQKPTAWPSAPGCVAGKAVLYARDALVFSADLLAGFEQVRASAADIPHPGQTIEQGQPVLSVLVQATDQIQVRTRLEAAASKFYQTCEQHK